jgi:hypothetical protein
MVYHDPDSADLAKRTNFVFVVTYKMFPMSRNPPVSGQGTNEICVIINQFSLLKPGYCPAR